MASTTRKSIRQKIHDDLYAANRGFRRLRNGPDASTLTEFTATTTVTDTALKEIASFPQDLVGAWIRLMYFDNSGTPALQEQVSRIHQYDPAVGTITFSPTIGTVNATAATVDGEYEIWPDIHPDAVDQFINDVLNSLIYEGFIPLTLVTDGDMEDSDLTNWTSVGSPTTDAKATSPFLVGRQAIHIVADAATEGRRSANIPVTPGEQFIVSVPIKVDVGTCVVTFFDVTNSEVIKAVTITDTAAVEVRFTESAPADCENVYIQAVSAASADDFYIGPISILSTWRNRYSVDSSTLDYADDIIAGYELPVGPPAAVNDTYLAYTEEWRQIDITKRDAERDALPLSVTVPPVSLRPIYIKAHQQYASLTADTDTTAAEKLIVTNGALFYIEEARGNARGAARRLRNYHRLLESAGLSIGVVSEPDRQAVRFS